jgi:hypothetical protein
VEEEAVIFPKLFVEEEVVMAQVSSERPRGVAEEPAT